MFSKRFAFSLGALALAVMGSAAQAQVVGPAPTATSIRQAGPFAISSQILAGQGFGGATVYSPNTPGLYPYIVFCPGFTGTQASNTTMARRLASWGFIVATIDTNSIFDFPDSRGVQMAAALRAVAAITTGPAAGKINRAVNKRGVTGHSMGGGGVLNALQNDRTLVAGFAFTPFNLDTNFGALVNQAVGIAGGQNDNVAPNAQHSTPFFNVISPDNPSFLCIEAGEDHNFVSENPADQPSSLYQISLFKVFLAGDTRFRSFLVPQSGCSSFRSSRL